MTTDERTEPTEHIYGYPTDPAPSAPTEPGVHRIDRTSESDTQLALRAIGWAALWFVFTVSIAGWLSGHDYGPTLSDVLFGVNFAAGAVLVTVNGHRRRQR